MKKIEPAVQTMNFFFSVPKASSTNATIDLSQCASLVNRRFYRQGINWAVSGLKVLNDSAGSLDGSVTVQKLPDTWVMSNAWEKGFRAWQRMNNEALEESESVRPRFLDFKVYADDLHHNAGFVANLLPLSSGGGFTPGEWQSSKMTVPFGPSSPGNVTDFEIIAVGANYPGVSPATGINAVSLIEGYANSRGLPNVLDPNAPDDAADADGSTPENWLAATFNDGTEQTTEIIESMVGPLAENNIAPYPFENDGVNPDTMYPGGANQGSGLQIHDTEYITGTTVGGTSRLKGGMFPCGLMRIVAVNNSPSVGGQALNFTLQLDLVPGSHRGYLCEPMTEM
jgi:hypothetical protein